MSIFLRASASHDLGVAIDTANPPCDFAAFVAPRHGISRERAEHLIESWLVNYCPRRKLAITIGAEPDAESYGICA
jgi:hypothetical protein